MCFKNSKIYILLSQKILKTHDYICSMFHKQETNEKPKHVFVRPKFPPLSTRLTSLRSLFMKPKSASSTTSTKDLTVSEMD